jgi:hypothetical protein
MARLPENETICDEKRLLICCARTKMPPAIAEQVRELAGRRLDWDYLLTEAAENSIGPLLDRNCRSVVPSAIPPDAMERLKNASRLNTVRNLFLTAELHKILELFRSSGIIAIPYKGPVLAEQAYGDLTLRNFDDLDIILPQHDLPKAHAAILELGYRPRFPWILSPRVTRSQVPGEYNYRNEERRVMVELHTELTLRHFPVTPNLNDFAQRMSTVILGGREVRSFSVEDLLPILCIHGSKDFWERISWVVDISELIQRQADLDWDGALGTAEALRAERMLHLGLALASDLLEAPLPEEILKRVRGDVDAQSTAQAVERLLLIREWPRLDARGRFGFRRRMVPGLLAGWRYSIRLAVIPAEEDWETMRLPGPLAPLYIALRPLRLLYKYGWMGARGREGASS